MINTKHMGYYNPTKVINSKYQKDLTSNELKAIIEKKEANQAYLTVAIFFLVMFTIALFVS